MKKRIAKIVRNTNETQISLTLNLDGNGVFKGTTKIGFLDHMLNLFAKHGNFNLSIKADGDLHIDDHHLIEDIGIVFGQALKKSLGEKIGIYRYGYMILPMDEALCLCSLDLSGRFAFETNYTPVREKINNFSTEMVYEFFKAISINAEMNLHIQLLNLGKNEHHRIEAIFKSFAIALKNACSINMTNPKSILSTKGKL